MDTQKKVFINICTHAAAEKPTDIQDRPVSSDPRLPTDGVNVPMAVGALNECVDHSGAESASIDVVVNPWCMMRVNDGPPQLRKVFKDQLSKLAVEWAEKEGSFRLRRPIKFIQAQYKGGLGKDGTSVRPFLVNRDPNSAPKKTAAPSDGPKSAAEKLTDAANQMMKEQQDPAGAMKDKLDDMKQKHEKQKAAEEAAKKVDMESPSDLMSMLGDTSDGPGHARGGLEKIDKFADITMPGMETAKASSGILVQDITDEPDEPVLEEIDDAVEDFPAHFQAPAPPAATTKKAKKGKPVVVVKKGFLNSSKTKKAINKKSLYEDDEGKIGSVEGRPEHPWNKIMGKSKVIDMNDMTPEQQKEYNKRQAEGENGQEVAKEILMDRPKDPNYAAPVTEEDYGDIEFEELMNASEPLYGSEAERRALATKEGNEEMASWADALSQPAAWEKERDAMKKQKEEAATEAKKEEAKTEKLRKGTTDYSKFEEIDEDCVEKEEERQEKIKRIREMKVKELQQAKKKDDLRAEQEGDHLVAEIAARKAAKKKLKKAQKAAAASTDASAASETPAASEKAAPPQQSDAQATLLEQQKDNEKAYWDKKMAAMKSGSSQPEQGDDDGDDDDVDDVDAEAAAKEQARARARVDATAAAQKEKVQLKAKAVAEDEIIELGADGTFDVTDEAVKAQKVRKDKAPGFNLKGAFDSKPSTKAKAPAAEVKKAGGGAAIQYKVKQEAGTVKVVISLPGVAGMDSVDLSISSRQILLKTPGFQPLKVELPVEVNEDKVKAKFSKTKCELTVKIPAA
jgi:hypothetical protein